MGVINMAHGELMMIGAYATYVVQNLFQQLRCRARSTGTCWPRCRWRSSSAALVGMVLERSVIRFLYGRPLETLLATWGISLILIQTVRTDLRRAERRGREPDWMSGGVEVAARPGAAVEPHRRSSPSRALVLGWRLAACCTQTRLGLFVRGVTQNRAMAACVGVPTGARRHAGLRARLRHRRARPACALSQIGNVGPDLGQSYIVDSFMVVVLGGVGQLAGTVVRGARASASSTSCSSLVTGAVLAKILVLVFIILFIQKRPQGLFALKGRAVEA